MGWLNSLFKRRGLDEFDVWAKRVVERAGFSVQSNPGARIASMLAWAAEQNRDMMAQSIGMSLAPAECVFLAAAKIGHNQSAIIKLAEGLNADLVGAEKALLSLLPAACDVAAKNGFMKTVEMLDRPPSS